MISLKADQKLQPPPRENFWLRHWFCFGCVCTLQSDISFLVVGQVLCAKVVGTTSIMDFLAAGV